MAFITVTNTFSNATTADATQVNANFTDIINGTSDGTKSFSISALTAAGASNLQAAVTLGASTSNDLVVNCALSSTLSIKTTSTYDIGSTTIGLRALYLGDVGAQARCTKIIGATIASGWTLTLPTTGGTANYLLQTNGSGTTSWANISNISARFYNAALNQTIGTSLTTIVGDTVSYDTASAVVASTGLFTAPITGKYRISSFVSTNTSGTQNADVIAYGLIKNGSAVTGYGGVLFGIALTGQQYGGVTCDTISLTAADTIGVQYKQTNHTFTANIQAAVAIEWVSS